MRTIIRWKDPQDFLHTKTKSIISGDVGGTKSWLVWFAQTPHQSTRVLFEQCYESAKFSSVSALLQTFMAEAGRTTPPVLWGLSNKTVHAGTSALLVPFKVADAEMLRKELGIPDVRFINDFQAAAAGVATLKKTDYWVLNAGLVRMGATRVITGAGTGLGLAWMQADKLGEYHTFSTEGGHIDYAPANQQQCDLLNWLAASAEAPKAAHVSWERILSGMGLCSLYQFHQQACTGHDTQARLDASAIHAAALQQEPVALAAVQMFVDIYAAWIGNLALLYQPRGGLYIAGGMAIHLQTWLKAERFLQIATDKGRMAELVRQTPIYLIANSRLGVQGAMKIASS